MSSFCAKNLQSQTAIREKLRKTLLNKNRRTKNVDKRAQGLVMISRFNSKKISNQNVMHSIPFLPWFEVMNFGLAQISSDRYPFV